MVVLALAFEILEINPAVRRQRSTNWQLGESVLAFRRECWGGEQQNAEAETAGGSDLQFDSYGM